MPKESIRKIDKIKIWQGQCQVSCVGLLVGFSHFRISMFFCFDFGMMQPEIVLCTRAVFPNAEVVVHNLHYGPIPTILV